MSDEPVEAAGRSAIPPEKPPPEKPPPKIKIDLKGPPGKIEILPPIIPSVPPSDVKESGPTQSPPLDPRVAEEIERIRKEVEKRDK